MVERINRAVSDCLILCAYSQQAPQDAAREYIQSLHRDPTWDITDVETVESLVLGIFARLQQTVGRQGWIK